ncbi:hypothetical protein NC653_023650 [Populus alba x Populus x berolinensis]|uniref:Uncharacterized protein n=1 Tax=Populus alba x Populus x berolinensis TaxID=444605 RepID=A0AAD6MHV5_9ROSI|nr:hypothetical protein NC653_023650 [Populus alba x Populus x berolinensis]
MWLLLYFVLSNTSSIVKALGVMNANLILCCNPTKDDKEEETEKALAVEESAEEKTKHGEIEEIPETETIEPEAHHEVDEEDYEMVSYKIKDADEEEEEDCSSGGGDEEEEEDCSSSVGDDDDDDREIGLLKELSEKNCKLMKDLADTLLFLEHENEVLSRRLISAESTSSTELYKSNCVRV